MSTQLALFPNTSVQERVLPKVHNMTARFEWMEVEYLLSLPSVDFHAEGLSTDENRDKKRRDHKYSELVEDIRVNGYFDPIFVYEPFERWNGLNQTEELGNGHHRLVAALDLGYTHVPVTRNDDIQWETSRHV